MTKIYHILDFYLYIGHSRLNHCDDQWTNAKGIVELKLKT